ncbi:MAG: hypothetical protein CVV21_01670 [Candidatus Goldiibacteriota bacterium HGW-Goldbacteria-1]|jgi:hypothetical protein|nr:MAG: hypothetical protein CVV21_01670 [Candidatus Goldiibacteriota bacterium HGW-Goldbacteria-1]
MGKKSLYVLSIIAIIFLVFFVDFKSKNLGVNFVDAYTAGFADYGPGLVNGFEGGSIAGNPPYPPFGPRNDIIEWKGTAPVGVPTPVYFLISGTYPGDGGFPDCAPGVGIMRIEWKGNSTGSRQYIELPAEKFENVGCTSPVYQTYEAKDWSCYDYVDLMFYLNGLPNGGIGTEGAFQTVSLFDGQITVTSNAVSTPVKHPTIDGVIVEHISVSLKYLANHYDVSAGRYFDISNIRSYSINAPIADYSIMDSESIVMYYDNVSLSAKDITNPPPVTTGISTTNLPGSIGVNLSWTISPAGVGKSPVSAYHIYRATAAAGPYISAGYQSATTNAYVDTSVPYGNATFCYKILTCDNGPVLNPADEKYNTINATYNEALLTDANSQCIFVPEFPTPTATRTPMVSPTVTPTFDPNMTPTAVVGEDIKEAHVYPNPFNPNAGTGKFKVDNVPVDTKIQIFSMDGSLVMEGVTSGTAGFTWDGRNKNGTLVVSGLYYLVLKDKKGKTDVKRIIVCYKCDPIDNE